MVYAHLGCVVATVTNYVPTKEVLFGSWTITLDSPQSWLVVKPKPIPWKVSVCE